jgi:hypothetical protein
MFIFNSGFLDVSLVATELRDLKELAWFVLKDLS